MKPLKPQAVYDLLASQGYTDNTNIPMGVADGFEVARQAYQEGPINDDQLVALHEASLLLSMVGYRGLRPDAHSMILTLYADNPNQVWRAETSSPAEPAEIDEP